MQKIESVSDMRSLAATFKSQGKSIALVPTQGALHIGQEVLIRAAVDKADVVIVSLFVNALQFPSNEVPSNYPRTLEADLALCEAAGAHVVFAPREEDFYPRGFSTYVSEETISRTLCGPSRPTHFRGVTTMTAKLFNLIRPDHVMFGQKTVQRAGVVRKMIEDLGYGIEVHVVPTAREPDGLAAGVRNKEFTSTMRQESLTLHAALKRVREMVEAGVRSPDRLIAEVTHLLGERRKIRVIYVSIVDPITMEPVREVAPGRSMLAIATWIDEVRLIDNAIL